MKKLVCFVSAIVMITMMISGCGGSSATSEMSNMASDAMSGAESMMDDMTGGDVKDSDGIIGNEDENNNGTSTDSDNKNSTSNSSESSVTDNSDNNSDNTSNDNSNNSRSRNYNESTTEPSDMLM